jgi:hypothetical protein
MKAGGKQDDRLDIGNCAYGPVIQELNTKQTERQRHGEGCSLRIPGAIVVDPHVRRLAELSGLTTSENAVWLMVVAVKEYAKSLIDFTISSTNAVEAGQLPPRLNARVPGKRAASDSGSTNPGESRHKRLKCISSIDLHSVASNLPLSGQTLGGCLSRETFERGLHLTYDRSSVIGENAFTDLKSFIIASVTPSNSKRLKVEPPKPTMKTSTDEALKGRKSPSVRGLGRGAKDLAALKARAGQISSNPSTDIPTGSTESTQVASSVKEQANTVTKLGATQTSKVVAQGASDTAPQTSETKPDLSKTSKSIPIVPGTSKASEQQPGVMTDESGIDAADPTESKQQSLAQRRGKGHGVKSLAAMRARSATSTELLGATQQVAASEPAETEQLPATDTVGAGVLEDESTSTAKVAKEPVEKCAAPEKKDGEATPEQKPRLESAIEEIVVVRRLSAEKRKASVVDVNVPENDPGKSDTKLQISAPSASPAASTAPAYDGTAKQKGEAPEISIDPANPKEKTLVPSTANAEVEQKTVIADVPTGSEGTRATTAAAPEMPVTVLQSASSAPQTDPSVVEVAAVESTATSESKSGDTASGVEPSKTPGEAETAKKYASEEELFR